MSRHESEVPETKMGEGATGQTADAFPSVSCTRLSTDENGEDGRAGTHPRPRGEGKNEDVRPTRPASGFDAQGVAPVPRVKVGAYRSG